MSRWVVRAVAVAAAATVGVVAAWSLGSLSAASAVRAEVLALAVIGLGAFVAALWDAPRAPSAVAAWGPLPALRRVSRRGRRAHPKPLPGPLHTLHLTVLLSLGRAGDVHLRLRAVLQEVVAARLGERGVDVAAHPEVAEVLLSPEAWELVRPDRPMPTDRAAPGISPASLTAVLTSLEEL